MKEIKKKWDNLSDGTKNIIGIIVGLVMLTGFIIYGLYNNYKKNESMSDVGKSAKIVTDNSRYFTALSCAQKYIDVVSSNNTDNILTLLNEEYKKEYNVDYNNIRNYIPSLENGYIYDYVGDEMYYKKISKNVSEYYVHGKIKKSTHNGEASFIKYDLTVILYENELVFSIRPGVSYEE